MTMKKIFFIILFLTFWISSFSQGVERWDVKTLNDSLAEKIDTVPIKTTVKNLRLLQKPYSLNSKTPRLTSEYQIYEIVVLVLDFKKQEDGDYHIIVCDTNDIESQMIVEVILPKYGNLKYYSNFKIVRDYLTYNIRYGKLRNNYYIIRGVAFFDLIHNQKGKAPNGLELHPVTYIKRIKKG